MRFAILAIALAACQSSGVSRELGARCDRSTECDERCLGPSAEWPGGFCTIACETDLDCPSDAVCLDEEGGVCAFACASDPACAFLGAGYACRLAEARGGAGTRMACRGS
jgi:hypothetical protein